MWIASAYSIYKEQNEVIEVFIVELGSFTINRITTLVFLCYRKNVFTLMHFYSEFGLCDKKDLIFVSFNIEFIKLVK